MDNKCTDLEHLFLCEDGLCENITSVFDCAYDKVQTPLDCTDKRNCITLDGLYDCKKGQCSKVGRGEIQSFLGSLSESDFRINPSTKTDPAKSGRWKTSIFLCL